MIFPEIKEESDIIKTDFKVPTEEQVDKITNILNMQRNMEEGIEIPANSEEKFDEMYNIKLWR